MVSNVIKEAVYRTLNKGWRFRDGLLKMIEVS